LDFIQGIRYRVMVYHVADGLELRFTAVNTGDRTLHNVVGVPCLGRPTADFRDPELRRTFVVTDSGVTPLAITDRGTGNRCRTHYLVSEQNPIRYCGAPFWGDLSKTGTTDGAIVRTSVGGRHSVGCSWERVAEIWDNQDAHGCIHSNFSLGDIRPGETKTVRGRIVLVQGGVEEALAKLKF